MIANAANLARFRRAAGEDPAICRTAPAPHAAELVRARGRLTRTVILDCAHYKDGARQNEAPLDIDEAAERCRDEGFVWLGLHDADAEEMREVADRFDLPPLAVEDAMNAHQRPKIEDYDDGYFLVLHTARYVDEKEEVEFGEVHVFTGPGYVIVVRHGPASELHSARERLEANPELLREGPAAAVWAITDRIVDDYEPVMAGIENDVEEVEVDVFGERSDETKRIYFLRRELAEFYRAVHPLLQPLELIVSQEHPETSLAAERPLSRRRRPRQARRGRDQHPARAADEHPAGEPRRHLGAAERRRQEDLRLGGDHHRADVHREHLRDELREHAGAALALRLLRHAAGDGRRRCSSCTASCAARAGCSKIPRWDTREP